MRVRLGLEEIELLGHCLNARECPAVAFDRSAFIFCSDIFAAEQNNTYKTKYSIGDIKVVNIGGTYVPVQIAAFDEGDSKITWISLSTLCDKRMNPTNTSMGGFASSELNTFLSEVIYPKIESTVRNNIVTIDKTCYVHDAGSSAQTQTHSCKLWIPSVREIFGESGAYENSGIIYSTLFTDDASRRKKNGIAGSTTYWWLRSVSSSTNFRCIYGSGALNSGAASYAYGVVLCFCT